MFARAVTILSTRPLILMASPSSDEQAMVSEYFASIGFRVAPRQRAMKLSQRHAASCAAVMLRPALPSQVIATVARLLDPRR